MRNAKIRIEPQKIISYSITTAAMPTVAIYASRSVNLAEREALPADYFLLRRIF